MFPNLAEEISDREPLDLGSFTSEVSQLAPLGARPDSRAGAADTVPRLPEPSKRRASRRGDAAPGYPADGLALELLSCSPQRGREPRGPPPASPLPWAPPRAGTPSLDCAPESTRAATPRARVREKREATPRRAPAPSDFGAAVALPPEEVTSCKK